MTSGTPPACVAPAKSSTSWIRTRSGSARPSCSRRAAVSGATCSTCVVSWIAPAATSSVASACDPTASSTATYQPVASEMIPPTTMAPSSVTMISGRLVTSVATSGECVAWASSARRGVPRGTSTSSRPTTSRSSPVSSRLASGVSSGSSERTKRRSVSVLVGRGRRPWRRFTRLGGPDRRGLLPTAPQSALTWLSARCARCVTGRRSPRDWEMNVSMYAYRSAFGPRGRVRCADRLGLRRAALAQVDREDHHRADRQELRLPVLQGAVPEV
jgi:hypothetical protein